MSNIYPLYTCVGHDPKTICQELEEVVFDYPFFNEGAPRSTTTNKTTYCAETISLPAQDDLLELKGLIFHTSHCGSTLLARMLNQPSHIRVVSEPEAINGLLLSKQLYGINEEAIINRLVQVVNLYRQKAHPGQSLILKLTSWNIYFISIFQQAFPGTKWIYIDRDFESLTGSLMQSHGGFVEWWDHPVDVLRRKFIGNTHNGQSKEAYIQSMINGHRQHAQQNKDSNSFFLEYPHFTARYEEILDHFGLELAPNEQERCMTMLNYDSKSKENRLWRKQDH